MVPDSSQVTVGSGLSLRIQISGAADVGSVPFHLLFDPAVLRFEGGEEGGFLQGDGHQTAFFAAPTSAGNEVVVGLSRLGRTEGVQGAGDLCTLHFTVVGAGDAQLSFFRAKVRNSRNDPAPATFEPASVQAR
jgi:cohesin domain-containing protein